MNINNNNCQKITHLHFSNNNNSIYNNNSKKGGDNNNSIEYNSKDRSKNRDKKGEGGIGGLGSKG